MNTPPRCYHHHHPPHPPLRARARQIIDVIFVVKHGFDGDSSTSDLTLFVISIVLSLWHASKCLYVFFKLRQALRSVKRASTVQHPLP